MEVGWQVLGHRDRWVGVLVVRMMARLVAPPGPAALREWLESDRGVQRVLAGRLKRHRPRAVYFVEPEPLSLAFSGLPELRAPGDLAAWLGWSVDVLAGHADLRHGHRRQPAFRDYLYRWRGTRLIEAPKDRLKAGQRQILRGLLAHVPVHPAAHGFVRGRSPRSHARLHTGCAHVLRVDLRQFFGTLSGARVRGWFRALGYPERVAAVLTGLVTTWTPPDIARELPWARPHLPQGAPTSPAIANAMTFGLDRRLAGLARRHRATYSRYADDLTFSGPRLPPSLAESIGGIARSEGFAVNPVKTRWMGRAVQQRVTGLVVNQHVAVSRRERDRLEALVHLCRTRGPSEVRVHGVEDLQSWLRGRIGWVAHARPEHGASLLRSFDAIDWKSAAAIDARSRPSGEAGVP